MGFRQGRKANDINYPLTGQYIEYDLLTQTHKNDNPITFKYRERDGFREVVENVFGNFRVGSSDISIEVYSDIKFKVQDVIKDAEGNEYKISDVKIEPINNPYLAHKTKRSYRKQIIFAG